MNDHDNRGFVVTQLERAITEVLEGNFVRAQGMVANCQGEIKRLAQSANQGIDTFTQDEPIKPPRVRKGENARAGRQVPLRASLAEIARIRGEFDPNRPSLLWRDDSKRDKPAGRWPPSE